MSPQDPGDQSVTHLADLAPATERDAQQAHDEAHSVTRVTKNWSPGDESDRAVVTRRTSVLTRRFTSTGDQGDHFYASSDTHMRREGLTPHGVSLVTRPTGMTTLLTACREVWADLTSSHDEDPCELHQRDRATCPAGRHA